MPVTWIVLALTTALVGDPPSFHVQELLHLPRTDGVTLTLVPAEPVELYAEYGRLPDQVLTTALQSGVADELLTFDLSGLRPGQRYDYRVWVRAPGEPAFTPREQHGFATLPAPGRRTRFAVLGDTHAYSIWTNSLLTAGGQQNAWKTLGATLDRLGTEAAEYDFAVIGTDTAMTKCGNCDASQTEWGPTTAGSANDLADAVARYRFVLSDKVLGKLGGDLPLVFGLGDHDGELGWNRESLELSRAARLAHLPDPGYWFSWRSGDVLLVMLDVHIAVTDLPTAPEHWTLGEQQFAWLARTLADSDAPLKIVMAEHVLGGHDEGVSAQWKGRGALRATDTGLPDGSFLGEQAQLHALMVQHEVDLFLSFHDHVVAHGEKDGVTYLIGGRASGINHPWADEGWYQQAMDWDLDGVPEYETDVSGTRRPGVFVITAEGGRGLAEYVLSHPTDEALDGQVLLRFPFGH